MEVRIADTEQDIRRAAKLLLQLRPKFDLKSLEQEIKAQRARGYQVAILEDTSDLLAVAGFRIDTKLAWGRHVYVDDLVTDESRRSEGAGRVLMDWLKRHAEDCGCRQIHIDSGVQNFGAHRFYLREGFRIASHHFSIVYE